MDKLRLLNAFSAGFCGGVAILDFSRGLVSLGFLLLVVAGFNVYSALKE